MSIGQVSQLLGVPVPTLRSWHERYGIGMPDRTTGGHRRYAEPQVRALRELIDGVTRGIAPSTTAQTLLRLRSDPVAPVALLVTLLQRIDVDDGTGMMSVLDAAEAQYGTEQAVHRVLIPAMCEIGLHWERGAVGISREILATATLRRWVAWRTGTVHRLGAAVLLVPAPGNAHTFALEAFGMLLGQHGCSTRELGANTSMRSIMGAAHGIGVQATVVTAHQASRSRPALEVLQRLNHELNFPLYYAGPAFDSPRRRRDAVGIYLGTALPDALQQVEAELRSR
jgi:DNA-binding transcriptional MerR regulator